MWTSPRESSLSFLMSLDALHVAIVLFMRSYISGFSCCKCSFAAASGDHAL